MGSILIYGVRPGSLYSTVLPGSGLGFVFIPRFAVWPVLTLGSVFIMRYGVCINLWSLASKSIFYSIAWVRSSTCIYSLVCSGNANLNTVM